MSNIVDTLEWYQKTRFYIRPEPTDIFGLKFFPSMEPDISNDRDQPICGWAADVAVSQCNLDTVRQIVVDLGTNLRSCMEIGVNRDIISMSTIIMDEKPADCFYLGIDLDDKSYLNDPSRNIWTMQANSHDQHAVRRFLDRHNVKQLDLLFIDGWHSVNTTVNDWRYADLIRPGGVVILHDTNTHPGCVAVFEAVDENMFTKNRLCTTGDFGISVFVRKF